MPIANRPFREIPEEDRTTLSDQTGPTKKNGSYNFLLLFWIPYISEEK